MLIWMGYPALAAKIQPTKKEAIAAAGGGGVECAGGG
jgi:hypothetical protein